ncbi:MAG: ATP-grasp domain-containing protein [Promethearchaeota archaeon]
MITLGLIIDEYHLEYNVSEFMKYMQSRAKINLYVEERYLLDFSNMNFKEDIFFVKAKGDLVINLAKLIDRETHIPIINSPASIWLCYNRFLNSALLKKIGINVPEFSLNPIGKKDPPFENYIVKNIRDQRNYAFSPLIKEKKGRITVSDKRALIEAQGGKENYQYLYYQQFIRSEWEYKVYCIGDNLFFYKQIPVLIDPDKMKSRRKINEIPELSEIAFKAIKAVGLKIASIDFLQAENGVFYLTDINSSPNFNYIQNGAKIVGDYLIKTAKS